MGLELPLGWIFCATHLTYMQSNAMFKPWFHHLSSPDLSTRHVVQLPNLPVTTMINLSSLSVMLPQQITITFSDPLLFQAGPTPAF